jgi:tetratricopeptide (TPR) repeat protein
VVAIETVPAVSRVILKAYNPHELSPETVKSVATGREQPLEHILEIIRRNVDAPSVQHVIVSAPRGYGKSFFLRYVEIRLAEIVEGGQLPIAMALLPEELPHVKEPDTLVAEIKRTFTKAPADTVGVRWVEDDGDAWDEAVTELDSAISEKFGGDRGLLVAGVENFDLLLRKAFSKSAQAGRLREFLTRRGNRVMLIAASARGAVDRDYDRPLFKAFEEIALEPWTIDQCLDFFRAQRREAKKPPLTDVQEAKAKAVATYIGGAPRLATMIGEALLEDDPLRAADLLERLVDELTPYYKQRVEVLPARSQGLLDALLRGGERCSATELARRVDAPNQPAIAAPLDELKKDLVVTGEKAPDSAEILLRVTDRVFAHYYRKRILSHGQETCPLEALVDLLAVIYSPEEKKREAEKLAERGLAREAAVFEQLWRLDQERSRIASDRGERDQASIFDDLVQEFDRVTDEGRYSEGLTILDTALRIARESANVKGEALVLCHIAWTMNELGREEEALGKAREAAAKAADTGNLDIQAYALRQTTWSLGKLGLHDEALAAAHDAVETAKRADDVDEQAVALPFFAWCLSRAGRHEEALSKAREGAAVAASADDLRIQVSGLLIAVESLVELERYDEALATAREAAEIAERARDLRAQAWAFRGAAWCLYHLGRHEEALHMAMEAASTAKDLEDINLQLGAAGIILLAATNGVDVDLAFHSYELHLRYATIIEAADPPLFFDEIARIATSRLAWPRLINLLASRPDVLEQIVEKSGRLGMPGRIIATSFAAGKLDSLLAVARHMVTALTRGIETAPDPRLVRLWTAVLNASAQRIATELAEPAFLKEIADIYAAHPQAPARATALLLAAATYHERGRDPAALARLDPDLATMLMAVFPPRGESPKRERKPPAKKKKPE